MPHPKRRHSKQRRDKRRTHDNAIMPTLMLCPNCGTPNLYHRICSSCGQYRHKQVYEVAQTA
ncbi:MAG: 50S ribosomal protein L32 [Bacteroidetes bacterium]|nr:50S ribosomal protein L32 [Bacteroidota bacterium]